MFCEDRNKYRLIVLCTLKEIETIKNYYNVLVNYLEPKEIAIIANQSVRQFIEKTSMSVSFIDENKVYPGMTLESVRNCICAKMGKDAVAANRAGWYFQQFLKMAYAYICEEENYLVWDADTIPTHRINMISHNGKKIFDIKTEYNRAYFRTAARLFPELHKKNKFSYISEHMIVDKCIMKEMLEKMESNDDLAGDKFWEKIISAIDKEDIKGSGFSEFETYGTYVEKYYPSTYVIRRWRSLREGTIFYKNYVTAKDLEYLSPKFDAVSFEKHLIHLRMQKILGHKFFQKVVIMELYQRAVYRVKCVMEKVLD